MYLISVEGGDGSGKGEAARLLLELAAEFPFPQIHATHEPRRHSELGKLALTSVKLGDKTPLEEAGFLPQIDLTIHTHGSGLCFSKAILSFQTATSTHHSSTRVLLAILGLNRSQK